VAALALAAEAGFAAPANHVFHFFEEAPRVRLQVIRHELARRRLLRPGLAFRLCVASSLLSCQ
jgi:hypothetical protein